MGTQHPDDKRRLKRQSDQPLPLVIDSPGRLAAESTIGTWLRRHGHSPEWLPRSRYSQEYCRFLARDEKRRAREIYDTLVSQGWVCWECGAAAIPQICDLHHRDGYENLNYENPTELVAVHRYRCHRKAHDELRRQQYKDACGCAA